MDIKKKETLRKHILEKIEAVKANIASFERLVRPISPDNAIGRISRMEAINSKSINESALSESRKTLANLQRTLPLIDDPEFGLCAGCEEPIPFKRLMTMPESAFCVQCAGLKG
ncbi:MAG: TraR/DksA C4-type zinc finger protein [Desulfobacterales bacterium]|nr:TraR/DksA C4-type zinc finger protein [Desulfobacterales bacterium]